MIIAKILLSLFVIYLMGYGAIVIKNIWTKELDLQKTFPNPFGFIHFKDNTADLKNRGEILSHEILEFLADRERSSPRLPNSATWKLDTEMMLRHSKETLNQYSIKFASRIISIRNELSSKGIIDEELEKFYEHPTNNIGIRTVGERIGSLSEKLQD